MRRGPNPPRSVSVYSDAQPCTICCWKGPIWTFRHFPPTYAKPFWLVYPPPRRFSTLMWYQGCFRKVQRKPASAPSLITRHYWRVGMAGTTPRCSTIGQYLSFRLPGCWVLASKHFKDNFEQLTRQPLMPYQPSDPCTIRRLNPQ